jgi:prolyl oligopeptidase
MVSSLAASGQQPEDPYLWLEDVGGDKALSWVKAQNAQTIATLEAAPGFESLKEKFISVLDSRERIPHIAKLGSLYYNFWRDAEHVRGVWRRTTLDEYRKPNPHWETVLDLDELARREGESWVWKGAQCLYPRYERCLLSLSRGGGDAVVIREFSATSKTFVDDGFRLPEAKSDVAWRNASSIYVATDFGKGSMTTSGYPREVREWKRGTALEQARHVYAAVETDVGVGISTIFDRGYPVHELIEVSKTFFTHDYFLREGADLHRMDVPDDARIEIAQGWLFVTLRADWEVGGRKYAQGALLVISVKQFMRGARSFDVLFEPSARRSLASFTVTRTHVLVEELDNVRDRVYEFSHGDAQWRRRELDMPRFGDIAVSAVDRDDSDDYWMTVTDFLTPPSLYLARAGSDGRERLKSLPALFDTRGLDVQQLEARS